MKQIIFSLIIFLFSLSLQAQWNDNGINLTTFDNVGIGTTSPDMKLSVFSDNKYISRFHSNETSSLMTGIRIGRKLSTGAASYADLVNLSDGFGISAGYSGSNLPLNTQNTDHIAIYTNYSSRNVGIGTTNPSEKLTVNGSAKFDNVDSQYTNLQIGHDSHDRIFADNSPDKYYGGGIFFRVAANPSFTPHNYIDVMTISDMGTVGIGTRDTEGFKLAVNGKIRAKEIKVETGWSDFVFYDDYKLPTLGEVESHIQEKGHLKDIPSAKEVEENGILLGEMDSKLLQKIEELTLYTIQQEKKIIEQSKDIEELKLLVKKLLKTN